MALLWLLVAIEMEIPRALENRLIHVGEVSEEEAHRLSQRLTAVAGVAEAVVIAEEGVAYLKVDQRVLDEAALHELSAMQV
jgi:hypothetical protein